ncbi:MAG: Gfo/Idh/MocA family oxidoreductase [Phycisphaerae bacterium]|nr:Gfo/Idh/MocA family oxidoreductase [Phycisphaerae bacterium]NIR67968.1 Gfo/Idh/MocA family oxidoreductase [candidate division Zixibacteria bacterium]NIP55097.1 Gfo/Idh/MocA family oxidoreductase [Phycisphaerae bacterium]NIS53802.1 Gfo/Idh/MocA family oxidoreductase [Phycisphaerae bacterium]NIU11400.1 Gfo/Idh/MocA family oxidoreductase [Phycisphaerae bacterium]
MQKSISRRKFLKTTAAGSAAWALSATSYSRIIGANDRISIGIIGCGSRGIGAHMTGVHKHAESQNMEITAVCDPWRLRQEAAAAKVKEWYGRDARKFFSYRDLLALKDVDAVMIASCDHQHTTHLKAAAEAGKDAYCEKPLAKRLDRLKDACDAVKKAKTVVQIGTQLRSLPSFTGCRQLYKTGILGTVGRIEQCRNGERPYWYSYVKDVKEKDVDWKEFLMDRPSRPFDPVLYSGWYGYREFSDGSIPGLGSHFIDLVHYITGAKFPTSCVCLGGTFTWKDEHKFTCPDHVQALWIYPEGFMVSYSTNFGNGSGNSFKIFGDQGVLDMVNWTAPILTAEGGGKRRGQIRGKNPVKEVPHPDHFLDWLQCIRTRNTPNACIDAGYQHAVACIMAMQSYDTGRRTVYDSEKREIHEG